LACNATAHHLNHLVGESLTLERQDCQMPLLGTWVADGACGDDPAWRWSGALEPGALYEIKQRGSDILELFVAGGGPLSACPPVPVRRRVDHETTTVVLLDLPDDAARKQRHPTLGRGVWIDTVALALALDMEHPLFGSEWMEGQGRLSRARTGQATVVRVGLTSDRDDGDGLVRCVHVEEVSVDVRLDGTDAVFHFVGQKDGAVDDRRCAP